jgi:hypothetical protein
MDLGEVGWGDVDWFGLAKDRNRWRALVNSVLTFGFHEILDAKGCCDGNNDDYMYLLRILRTQLFHESRFVQCSYHFDCDLWHS